MGETGHWNANHAGTQSFLQHCDFWDCLPNLNHIYFRKNIVKPNEILVSIEIPFTKKGKALLINDYRLLLVKGSDAYLSREYEYKY